MGKKYKPYMNVPTGEFIREELEARNWTQEDLAKVLGISLKTVNQIIKGKQSLSIETARLLSKAFGQSPQYWLNIDMNYRARLQGESQKESETAIKSMLFKYMPIREMIQKGWLRDYENLEELVEQVKEFWEIKKLDLSFLDETRLHCFRHSPAFPQYSPQYRYYAQTWLQMARKCARNYRVSSYKPEELKRLIRRTPEFTCQPNGIPEFIRQLNKRGVKFFVLTHLTKTYIDGAAFFDNGNPVIVYTQRYDRIDHFWFTIAHEIAHILFDFQSTKYIFIDGLQELTSIREKNANLRAEKWLGIPDVLRHFRKFSNISEKRVLEYSHTHNVHPAIIVGALQFHDILKRSHLNKYKTPVSQHIPNYYYVEKII